VLVVQVIKNSWPLKRHAKSARSYLVNGVQLYTRLLLFFPQNFQFLPPTFSQYSTRRHPKS